MRLALVINSTYSENNVVAPRDVFGDTGSLVESRLANADTGFEIVRLNATRDLPEQLEALLETHRADLRELLIHFSGYLAVKPDRGLALLLDGARLRAYPISRLRASISPAAGQSLVIMDVLAVADTPPNLSEIADGLGLALNATTPHVAVLSSVALSENVDLKRRGCLRLSDLWLLSLQHHAGQSQGSPVDCTSIVRGLMGETLAYASLPSFNYQRGVGDFLVLPGSPSASAQGSSRTQPTDAGWREQADYYPSAPPPTVQPKGLSLPPLAGGYQVPSPVVDETGSPPRSHAPEVGLASDSNLNEQGNYDEAVALLESKLTHDPRHLPSLRALSDAAQRQRDVDTAALASAVLVCLESARPEDEIRLRILVTDGLPLAQRTLNDRDFDDTLLANQADRSLLETLGRLTDASIAGGLVSNVGYEELPKDAAILDPESSTVTLGRSLGWVSKFLGINTPELVVLSELPTHMLLTSNGRSRLLISKQLGSGLSLAQLAFLGARHLSMLRHEFTWRAGLDSPERLGTVILHCIRFCREGREFVKSISDSERKGAKRFLAQIEADASLVQELSQLFAGVELDQDGCESLARQVLITTDRVLIRGGLVACANPAAAWQLTRQYPLQSLLSVEEQLDEVARFATSRSHLTLRRSLGMTVN